MQASLIWPTPSEIKANVRLRPDFCILLETNHRISQSWPDTGECCSSDYYDKISQ
jgi:hypothetical protein